ncbi:hypothetical protein J6590_020894 [Homalodisca vitripennis]|nr:hypothetical protein J6590_020894 [Homalodisca vitripennis]
MLSFRFRVLFWNDGPIKKDNVRKPILQQRVSADKDDVMWKAPSLHLRNTKTVTVGGKWLKGMHLSIPQIERVMNNSNHTCLSRSIPIDHVPRQHPHFVDREPLTLGHIMNNSNHTCLSSAIPTDHVPRQHPHFVDREPLTLGHIMNNSNHTCLSNAIPTNHLQTTPHCRQKPLTLGLIMTTLTHT